MVESRKLKLPVSLPRGFEACARCSARVKDSIMQMEGVQSVDVDFEHAVISLAYDPRLTPLEDVESRMQRIGMEIKERFEHKTFALAGLDCPDCALKLEKSMAKIPGVLWVSANFASAKMSVEYEPARVDTNAIESRVRQLGYGISQIVPEAAPGQRAHAHAQVFPYAATLTVLAGALILAGAGLSGAGFTSFSRACYLLAAVAGGVYAARGAFYSLKVLELDMNFLMTVAALGAIAIGDWFEAAAVMFLFSLGNALEARTVERARRSVNSLVNLFPTQARVKRDGKEEMIPVLEVRAGEEFVVRPGEKIPTDGMVITGSSTVNQALITGESTPVEKGPGDTVFAGSINERGSIDVAATSTAEDNTLARIIHMVEEAQAQKAPTQRFTEVFGRYYTPSVVALAVLTAALFPLLFSINFKDSFYMALTLLVVACPCALVISTPVTVVSAIGNAARNGVLIKGGAHLESAGSVQVIAFDKTGTITTGNSSVTDIISEEGWSDLRVLAIAAGVEARSEHPLAEAIRREASRRGVDVPNLLDFEALTGMGAAAKFNGDTCIVGNSRLMNQMDIDISSAEESLLMLQAEGKTAVFVAWNRQLAGIIALRDTVRERAKEIFRELKKIGIKRMVMITGDNEPAARAVARELEIDEYYAELLPQDKVDIVRVLIDRYGSRVAVVGDGVNDAPALAAATVGIAMGAAGSDTALETADVALMAGDLSKLPYALRLSRTALKTVKQNITFSLAIILILIASALSGRLALSMGVVGHEGSALLVIANGMRLLRFR
jgi:Cd2+/Zn2+-exporting ATPase